ncbi:MAG: polyprenyl synthetase family protein [bacterium]
MTDSRPDVEETFKDVLRGWRQKINERLANIVETQKPALLYEPIRYVLQGGGKRIRPVMVLLSCQAVGGKPEWALDAAVAVELVHNFTLVHDDIMDEDDKRRGRLTLHKKWNQALAILAGDGLFALSYQTLLRTQSARIHEITNIFTNGILAVCEGQALDLEFEKREAVGLDDYLAMIQKKTARLLAISAEIGALIGNGGADEVKALGDFANNLGCAFQIQDDLLDITSNEGTLGKTFGSDIQQRKQTYLLVHAWRHADSDSKAQLQQLLSETEFNHAQVAAVKSIFDRVGSIQSAKAAIKQYTAAAEKSLEQLGYTLAKEKLMSLLRYVSTRIS